MPRCKSLALLLMSLLLSTTAHADEALTKNSDTAPNIHDLHALRRIAKLREKQIRKTVKDYTCLIVKRERIHGVLQSHRFIEARVRPERVVNGKTLPLAVQLHFLRPAELAGRMIIYVEGKNEGKMLVRRGGKRLSNIVVDVDPDSELAKTETLMHIESLGFDRMISDIAAQIESDIASDPTSDNTELRVSRNASINKRSCTSVQITHAQKESGLTYHRAEFFVDNEYHLPVRVAAYDWPKQDGGKPRLLAEFTYTNVKINVGLRDADFDMDGLRTASR